MSRPAPATWRQLHAAAVAALGPGQEPAWLVEEASGDRWPACAGEVVTRRSGERFEAMLARRLGGEPLQYVLGSWAFRTLELMVDRRVLIPRPETETVVEVALAELDRLGAAPALVADLGTGSGAIALSVAAERPGTAVWATDRSPDALDVARANLAGVGRRAATVRLAAGDWWAALPAELAGAFDLVVSNPPYLADGELEGLDPVVSEWEPAGALAAGPVGTEAIAAVLAGAPRWLAPTATVVLELSPAQAPAAVGMARGAGFDTVEVFPDLSGRDRVLVARR